MCRSRYMKRRHSEDGCVCRSKREQADGRRQGHHPPRVWVQSHSLDLGKLGRRESKADEVVEEDAAGLVVHDRVVGVLQGRQVHPAMRGKE